MTQLKVHSPLGFPPKIEGKGLAPGLPTLNERKLFLVDVGFENSDNFMVQLRDWFGEHHPGVETEVVRWHDQHRPDPELCTRIKAEGDAAILGVGLWSTCAPEVSGHTQALETEYGVPSVAVHADAFARLVDSVLRVNGIPKARRAFVPTPVMAKSPAELRAYIEGDDPVRGRPFMAAVIEALTRPMDEDARRGVEFDRSSPRLLEPDDEERLHRLFRENGWTDYLPIVLPTQERVEAMLAGTSRAPDEIVGRLRPTNYREFWEFTVEQVAVNAVMAGADPAYLPVILALAASGFTARSSSTSSIGHLVIVNGPIRNELGMNSGLGALGPYNHANATIGRAYSLLSQNLQGGSVPGESYMGCQGNNYSYAGVVFAENEESSPWEPYHVQQGFAPDESAVTTMNAWGNVWTEGLRSTWQEKLKAILETHDPFLGTTLVFDPIVANDLTGRGFDSKEKLVDWIYENVRIPAFRYWDYYCSHNFIREDALNGIEPYATYRQAERDELIPMFERDKIQIAVAGGSSNGQWSAFIGGPLNERFRQSPDDVPTVAVDPWR